jgi:hypothetical protein
LALLITYRGRERELTKRLRRPPSPALELND